MVKIGEIVMILDLHRQGLSVDWIDQHQNLIVIGPTGRDDRAPSDRCGTAEDVLEGRTPSLGSAAERRLEWARAELALLRRDGPTARAIVDALLRAHPGDARTPIPQLLLVRGAAFLLERRYGSAIQALERARDAVLAAGGLALTLRIQAVLATAFASRGRDDEAELATARMIGARDELLARAAEVGRNAECRAGVDRVLSPPGRVALRKQEADRFSGLTQREREIAALIGNGGTNGEIAGRLNVSPRTVETADAIDGAPARPLAFRHCSPR